VVVGGDGLDPVGVELVSEDDIYVNPRSFPGSSSDACTSQSVGVDV
jgi:hypothetical protein